MNADEHSFASQTDEDTATDNVLDAQTREHSIYPSEEIETATKPSAEEEDFEEELLHPELLAAEEDPAQISQWESAETQTIIKEDPELDPARSLAALPPVQEQVVQGSGNDFAAADIGQVKITLDDDQGEDLSVPQNAQMIDPVHDSDAERAANDFHLADDLVLPQPAQSAEYSFSSEEAEKPLETRVNQAVREISDFSNEEEDLPADGIRTFMIIRQRRPVLWIMMAALIVIVILYLILSAGGGGGGNKKAIATTPIPQPPTTTLPTNPSGPQPYIYMGPGNPPKRTLTIANWKLIRRLMLADAAKAASRPLLYAQAESDAHYLGVMSPNITYDHVALQYRISYTAQVMAAQIPASATSQRALAAAALANAHLLDSQLPR